MQNVKQMFRFDYLPAISDDGNLCRQYFYINKLNILFIQQIAYVFYMYMFLNFF